jgi:hypothetical protein
VEYGPEDLAIIIHKWHRQWIMEGHSEVGTDWTNDWSFAQARLQGVCHVEFVIPVPPFSGPSLQGYAIIDLEDDPGPPVGGKITMTYEGYHAALRVAAERVAAENETEVTLR